MASSQTKRQDLLRLPLVGEISVNNLAPEYDFSAIIKLDLSVVKQFLTIFMLSEEEQTAPYFQLVAILALNDRIVNAPSTLSDINKGTDSYYKYKNLTIKGKYLAITRYEQQLREKLATFNIDAANTSYYDLITFALQGKVGTPNILSYFDIEINIHQLVPVTFVNYMESFSNFISQSALTISLITARNSRNKTGRDVLAITNAPIRQTPGGISISDTRAIYIFTPDADTANAAGQQQATYTGDKWPYVYYTDKMSITIEKGVQLTQANIGRDNNNVLTINGYPVYQFVNDTSPTDVNGNGVGDVWYAFDKKGQPLLPSTTPVQKITPLSAEEETILVKKVPDAAKRLPVTNEVMALPSPPISMRYSLDYINEQRLRIHQQVRQEFAGTFSVTVALLKLLYEYYDQYFFNNQIQERIARDNGSLTFITSTRLTSTAGSCESRIGCTYRIKMSIPIFTEITPSQQKPLFANGVACADSLACLQIVFEHELAHMLVNMTTTASQRKQKPRYYKGHGTYFKQLVAAYFGHSTTTHSLKDTPISLDERLSKDTVKKFQLVEFEGRDKDDKRLMRGVVEKLNPKRARIRVDNSRSFYNIPYASLRYSYDDDGNPVYYRSLAEGIADILADSGSSRLSNSVGDLLNSRSITNNVIETTTDNVLMTVRGQVLLGPYATKDELEVGSYVAYINENNPSTNFNGYVTNIKISKVIVIDDETKQLINVNIASLQLLLDVATRQPIVDISTKDMLYLDETIGRANRSKSDFRKGQRVFFITSDTKKKIYGVITKLNRSKGEIELSNGGKTAVEYHYLTPA